MSTRERGSANLPPLDGKYVTQSFVPDGLIGSGIDFDRAHMRFDMGGKIGTVEIDGSDFTLDRLDGPTLHGTVIDANTFTLGKVGGPVPLTRFTRLTAYAPQPIAEDARPHPDLDKPWSTYTVIEEDPHVRVPNRRGRVLIAAALSDPPWSDEEKLMALSTDYAGTLDSFKKKDLASSELQKIQAAIEPYQAQRYYAMAIRTEIVLDPYDQALHRFRLRPNSFGSCWGDESSSSPNGSIVIVGSKVGCWLPVTDENQARTIERARASARTQSASVVVYTGLVYFFVTDVKGPQINIVVTGVHAVVGGSPYNPRTVGIGTALAEFDLVPPH
jgi:hypothetical protein